MVWYPGKGSQDVAQITKTSPQCPGVRVPEKTLPEDRDRDQPQERSHSPRNAPHKINIEGEYSQICVQKKCVK